MSVIGRIISNWFGGNNPDYTVAVESIGNKDYQYVIPVNSSGNLPDSSSSATRTQVADSATDVLVLAANTSRVGATIFNDSSALLYLGLGTTTVTSTNYSLKIFSNGYYEVPFGYTGQIRGIWATDPNDGAARITELT